MKSRVVKNLTYIVLAVITALASACVSHQATTARYNFGHVYDEAAPVAMEHALLDGDKFLRLYLLFRFRGSGDAGVEPLSKRYDVRYAVTTAYESQQALLQDTLSLARSIPDGKGGYQLVFNIQKPEGVQRALMVVTVTDRVTGIQQAFDIPMDFARLPESARYGAFNRQGGRPLYGNLARVGDTISLRSMTVTGRTIIMRQYEESFPAALPPMAVSASVNAADPRPLATFTLSQGSLVAFRNPGIYLFYEDTAQAPLLSVLVGPAPFPRIAHAPELVQPLIYMTTRAERSKFGASPIKKTALDQFWLDLAGNRDFARRVIKAYYENVEYANVWFSDYREGWKTDRGMMLIVFGKPGFVQRTGSTETWLYEERAATPSLRFTFDRKQGALGQSIWELRRTEDYSTYWYTTVDQWRKGIVRR